MDLFSKTGMVSDSSKFYQYNTGTMIDLLTGSYVKGVDGSYILQGGIGISNGWGGIANGGKSSMAAGMNVLAMERYPGSQMILADSEASVDKLRLAAFSNLGYDDRFNYINNLCNDRIRYFNAVEISTVEELIEVVIKPLIREKEKYRKDLMRKTPFRDPRTGENVMMILPTFLAIDSWSEFKVDTSEEMLKKHGISASESNTVAMKEGLIKARFLRDLSMYALRYGIIITMTAQIEKINTMGRMPNAAPQKELPAMKGDMKYVNVGNKYKFLISNLFGITLAKPMVASNKVESEFYLPNGLTSCTEFQAITISLERCKNNGSNIKFKPVVSQAYGYQNGLSNLQLLRDNKYFGLGTNMQHPRPVFLPETTLSRKDAMTKLQDPKTARAIEIIAQLFISQTFVSNNTDVNLNITPEQLMDKLSKSTYKVDDILNSRGWWTFEDTEESKQPYMSLPDIVKLVS